ncbi:tudor domain-containing protein 1-like [Amia ocellicauda]|uniref:tudor domain-containing protein 1-like n=1 Tax=Amia ocellicauda TaxID=2972642 RepID=UPI0034647EEC
MKSSLVTVLELLEGNTVFAVDITLTAIDCILNAALENFKKAGGAIEELQVSLREQCMQTATSEDFRPAPGAVCCSQFTGDERMPREWTKDASRRFQQLTAAVQLQAKVLCTSERRSGIELLRDGQSIGDILTAEEMSICKTTTVSAPPVTTAAPIPEPRGGFPKDWKTVVLPTSDTFQLHIAVVRSPSLFYALTADQPVEVDKLRALMMDLADHCNKQDPNCGIKYY